MLKIAAFDDYESDHPILLKLVTHEHATDLIVVDEHGDHHPAGNVLRIAADGVHRFTGISPEIGLPLDSEGEVKIAGWANVIDLLKPIAEYVAERRERDDGQDRPDDLIAKLVPGAPDITIGLLQSLADYYERNK